MAHATALGRTRPQRHSEISDVPFYAANVALTRRTARFGELARAADAELACRGVDVDAAAVDEALNARVARSAQLLGVEPRAALAYAPDDVAAWIADELAGAAPAAEAAPGVVIDLAERRNSRYR